MEEAYTRLRDRLEGLTDEEFFWQPVPNAWTIYQDRPGHWTYPEAGLDQPRKTNWGEMWPAWRIFTTMIDHDALHTGTIGCLRDLYVWRSAART